MKNSDQNLSCSIFLKNMGQADAHISWNRNKLQLKLVRSSNNRDAGGAHRALPEHPAAGSFLNLTRRLFSLRRQGNNSRVIGA